MGIEERLERIERSLLLSLKKALNVADVALLLGISESRVRHMVNDGLLPYSKPNNGKLYFDKADIERYLLADRRPSKAEIESMAATRMAVARIK